ncbi:hypothetical protein [Anabaena catenula]|uniref:Uncharacterized protein n=1 Tax=Anabaena catenula FACHB-362 TaxID=2692877 RepID=A0ABR8J6C6_9NOST|nr:hypothetical protein [Anabaena catenula]MBD2693150.1 hypothetical protein [Anabaena catenula FACHB-362]
MPHRHYPPAYLRYFKARLSNFLRPSFWGTGIFLLVVVVGIREYWINPELFTKIPTKKAAEKTAVEKTADTSLSDEDKAIAADIDNMPNFLTDFEQAALSANVTPFPSKIKLNNSDFFVEDLINKKNTADEGKFKSSLGITNNISSQPEKNPFMVQSENLLKSDNRDLKTQFSDVNNFPISPEPTAITDVSSLSNGLTNQTTNNQSTVIISPLEAAIKRSSNTQLNPSISNVGVKPISPTNSLPNQGLSSGSIMGYNQLKVTDSPQNSYGNLNSIPTAPNVVTPTTGTSAVLNNPYAVQPPSQGIVNSTAPVGYGINANNSLQQPSQLPQSNLNYPGQVQPYPNGSQR